MYPSRITQSILQSLLGITPEVAVAPLQAWSAAQVYQLLEDHYFSNGLYFQMQEYARINSYRVPKMMELGNPTYAAVEFYARSLWPGPMNEAFKIATENQAIIPAIQQVWKWSNFEQRKQRLSRLYAIHGDMFARVMTKGPEGAAPTGLYVEPVSAKYVTDFNVDERGYVIYLRHDCAETVMDGTKRRTIYKTQVWDKDTGVDEWTHEGGPAADMGMLGKPDRHWDLSEWGIDYLPWVHSPFIDAGEFDDGTFRGLPLIFPCLTKIHDLDMKMTRLGELLFRYGQPTTVVSSNDKDASGRPIAAPRLENTVSADGDTLYLPGVSSVNHLVANINYEAHFKAIESIYSQIERDLPVLVMAKLADKGATSGYQTQLYMAPAVAQLMEVRANGYNAMARLMEMALDIGGHLGIFNGIGTYEAGDFQHTYSGPDPFPPSQDERLGRVKTSVESGVPLSTALQRYDGWSKEEADAAQAESRAAALAQQQAAQAPQAEAGIAKAKAEAAALTPVQQQARKAATIDKTVPAAADAIAALLTAKKPEASSAQIEAGLDAIKAAQKRAGQ